MFLLFSRIAQKKTIFDQYGEEGLKRGGGGAGGASYSFSGDPHEIFSKIFGGASPFGDMFSGGAPGAGSFEFLPPVNGGIGGIFSGKMGTSNGFEEMDFTPSGGFGSSGSQQDKAVHHNLNLSLEELYQGCTKKMKISRKVVSAGGTSTNEDKVVEIPVKAGWKEGTKITFPREGDQYPGRIPADIVFVIKEKPHDKFKREGNNLKYTAKISLKDALCGVDLHIPQIDTTVKKMTVRDIIAPGSVERLDGCGMPLSKEPGHYGDLLVEFDIQFPKFLKSEDKKALKKLLP